MAIEPVNVFSHRIDPEGVVALLRREADEVVVRGVGARWRDLDATVGGRRLVVGHSPDYYAGPGWPKQVEGMAGYFSRFPDAPRKQETLRAIRALRFALSFPEHDLDIETADPRNRLVFAIARHLDAVIFTPSALRDASGRVLLGATGAHDPAAVLPEARVEPRGPTIPAEAPPPRRARLERLAALGFSVAPGLPYEEGRSLRPVEEIARRLMALDALFSWVAAPETHSPSARLRGYAERNRLVDAMTPAERAIFALPRDEAHAGHVNAIGWRLENMWPLAWALGFEEEPSVKGGMISDATIGALLNGFMPKLDETLEGFVSSRAPRLAAEVDALEDLFYCAHNAVRSAQLGRDTVPPGFHPVGDGGVVHERRHALTWMVSPGVAWEDTDLST
ncbi:MAG: DUF4272 domain-containing protein [Sandaracinaceae bacterium]